MRSTLPAAQHPARGAAPCVRRSTIHQRSTMCATRHNMHTMHVIHDTDNEVIMYISEMLIRDQHSERLKQARESRLARQVSELRHLRRLQRRAERPLREVPHRARELSATLIPTNHFSPKHPHLPS